MVEKAKQDTGFLNERTLRVALAFGLDFVPGSGGEQEIEDGIVLILKGLDKRNETVDKAFEFRKKKRKGKKAE